MYIAEVFEETDLEKIIPVFQDYPFATMISIDQDKPLISQLPLSYDVAEHCFYGHLARANPHYHCLTQQPQVQLLFHGPHAYVSPRWYATPGVPTWNYVSVEVEASVELLQEPVQLQALLEKQLAQFDPALQSHLMSELDENRKQKMLDMICGFRVDIVQIKAKFKLSQNRAHEDRQAIIEQFRQLAGDDRQRLADLMEDEL